MTISIQTILQNNLPLGYTGSIGYTGSSGAGFTGSASSGYTGSAGISGQFAGLGYSGSGGLGYTGSQGSGYTGSIGYVGSPGQPGLFAGMGYVGSAGSGYIGSVGGFNSLQAINVQTGTNYTVVSTDAGAVVELYNLAPINVNIPPDSLLNFGIGQRIDIVQASLGSVFFTGGLGVVVNVAGGINYLNQIWTGATLLKTNINEWLLVTPSPTGFTGSTGVGFQGSAGAGYAGSIGGFSSVQPINIQTGTSYVIQTADAGSLLEFFNTSTITVNIPPDSALPFSTGQRIDIIQRGAGAVFFNGGPGVLLITPDVNYLNIPNVAATLIKTAYNEWTLITPSTVGYTGSTGAGFIGSAGTLGYAGSVGGFASVQPIVAVTSTSYTFQSADAGDLVQFFNTATSTVTIAPDSTTFFPVGTRIDVVQRSIGAVFFVGGAGVTVNTPDVNYINVTNVSGTLIKTAANEWLFTGPAPSGYAGSSGAGFVGSVGTVGYAGSTGGFASAQQIVAVTATSYTFQLADAGDLVQFNNTATTTVTIAPDSTTFFPIGTRIDLVQRNLGAVFFVGGVGVIVNTPDVNYINVPNISATIIKTGVNEWLFTGPSPSGYVGSSGSGYSGSSGTSGYIGSTGGFNSIQTISVQTGTSYVIQTGDAGTILEFFSNVANTVTIPTDSALYFSVGQRIDIIQRGLGAVFFTGSPGVNLITPDVNYLNVQNVGASLVKTAANEWTLITPAPSGYTGSSGSGFIGSAGILGFIGSTGGFASAQVIVSVTSTNYTFQLTDAGDLVQFFNTATTTVTVPNDSATYFPIGTRIEMVQRSTGPVFFVGQSGVTVVTPDVNYISVPNISATIIKTGVNEWLFTGPAPSGYVGSSGSGYVGSAGLFGYSGSLGGFASAQTIVAVTGTTYTFQLSDAGDLVQFYNTATTTVIVPNDNDAYFSVGTRIEMVQRNIGPVFFVGGSGVNLITPDVNYINVPNISATIIKTASNEWLFTGPSPSGYAGSSGAGYSGSAGTFGYSGSVGSFASAQPIASVTATSYTFQLTDAGNLLQFFNTATTTVTIPNDSATYFPIGTRIEMVQRSTGPVFFVGGVSVNLVTPDVNYINVPNLSATVIKTGVNEWLFTGPSPSGYVGSAGVGYSGSAGLIGYAGSLGGFGSIQVINVQTGTNYSIQSNDAGSILEFFNTATTTVTIPPDSSLSFYVGQRIDVIQRGLGQVFFAGGVGVTVITPDVNYLSVPNTGASLVKTAANEWTLITPAQSGYTGSVGAGYSGSQGFVGYVGSLGGFGSIQVINIQTGTNYSIQTADAGSILEFFNTATTTVTIPADLSLPFYIGQRIDIIQRGLGQVFFAGGSGVTLITPDVNYLSVPNTGASLIKTSANEWTLITPAQSGYTGSVGAGYSGSQGFVGFAGSVGGFASAQLINIQTGTSYSIQSVDAGVLLEFFNTATTTVTIPNDSVLPFSIGQRIDILQRNIGAVFFVGGSGVTVNSPDVNYINAINVGASLVKTGVNEWFLTTPSTTGFTGSTGAGFVGSSGAGYAGSAGGFNSSQFVNIQTGTVYTVQLSDAGSILEFFNSATTTVTVPSDSVYQFQIGQRIDVVQRGSGSVFIVAGGGTNLYYQDINFLAGINSAGTLTKTGNSEWLWTGPGAAGYTGSFGYTGSVGFIGSQGPKGDPGGYTGSAGTYGYTGSLGSGYTGSASTATGFVGSVGALGYTGSSAGYTGSSGAFAALGYAGSAGSFASAQPIISVTATSYTFQLADAGDLVQFNNTATITVTVAPDSSILFPIGTRIDLVQRGTGSVFFVGGAGVLVNAPDTNYINLVNDAASIIKTGANEWLFTGPSRQTGYTGSGAGYTGSSGTLGFVGSVGGFNSAQVVSIQTSTAYTIQTADAGAILEFFNTSTNTITIPPDSQLSFATGQRIDIIQRSIGAVFFTGGVGVTLIASDVNYLNLPNAAASLVKTAVNEWTLITPAPSGYTGSIGASGFVGSTGIGFVGSVGGFNSAQVVSIQTSTAYTIQTADAGIILEFFNTSTNTITIPPDSQLSFGIGQRIDILQRGAGAVFFTGGVGVTLITPDVNYINLPNTAASLIKTAINEWTLITPSTVGYTGSIGFTGFAGSSGSLGYIGSAGGFASAQIIVAVTATSYTFQLSDAGDLVQFNNTATITVTVAPDSSILFPVGTRIDVVQRNSGPVFFLGGAGVTVNSSDVNYLSSLNVSGSLIKTAANEWLFTGPSQSGYTGSSGAGFIGSAGQGYAGSAGGFASAQIIVAVTATSYTFQLADAGDLVQFVNTSTTIVTIAPDSATFFPIGTRIDVVQRNAGSVFFVGGAGVTVNTPDVNYLSQVNLSGSLIKTAVNEWLFTGPSPGGYVGSVGTSGFIGSVGVIGYSGSTGGFASAQIIVAVTATAYTLQITDAGDLVQFFNTATTTVTVPNDNAILFPVGTRIDVVQRNTGAVFFVGGSGVTVNSSDVNYINIINVSGSLIKTGANEWLFTGPSPAGYTGSSASGFVGSAGLGYIGSAGGFTSIQPISIQTGTSYTIQTNDAGSILEFFNSSTNVVTIPNDSALFFSIGQRIDVLQRGLGSVFFVGGSGVAVNTADVNYLGSPNSGASLIKTGANEWSLITPSPAGYTGSVGPSGFIGSLGVSGYIGSTGGFNSIQPISIQTGTSYVIQTADAGSILEFFNTATTTISIPPDSSLPFLVGQRIDIIQRGVGTLFFASGPAVALIAPDVNYINVPNTSASLVKTAANEWTLITSSPNGYTGSTGLGFVGSVGTVGYSGSTGGFASAQIIVAVTATSYTFQLSDAGDLVQFFNTATTTVTIPNDSAIFYPIGTRIEMVQRSTGPIFFVGANGVTVNTPDVNYINVPNISATIIKTSVNEWLFTGPSPSGYTGSIGAGFVGSAGSSGYSGSVGSFASIQFINIQTGTNYTIQSGDAGSILEFFNTGTNTVTIPPESQLPFAIGQRIDVIQRSVGPVFFTGGVGVTLITPDVNYINVPNAGASLVKTASNEWTLITPSPTGYVGSSGIGFVGSIGSSGYVGSVGGFNSIQPVNIQTGTSYILSYTDAGSVLEFFNSATTTVTIPPDGVSPFTVGQRIDILQRGVGAVFFNGGPGVTINSPDVNFVNSQNAAATLVKTAANEWSLVTPASMGYTGSASAGYVGSTGAGFAGSVGGFASVQPIVAVTSTSYTFQLTDAGDLVQFFNSATTTVTIPGDGITNFPVGTRIDVSQRGAGAVFFVGGSGVTLSYSDTNFLSAVNSAGTIVKINSNEWLWTGPGPAGYTGSIGPQGPTGNQGPAGGYTGSQGAGYGGSQGNVGPLGYVGSQGAGFTGSFGYIGSVGYIGSIGIQGYTGSYGFTGFQGSIGAQGYSGSSGYTGSQSYTGSFGYSGSQGYTGSQGIGYTGSQSYTGSFGYSGSFGYAGSQGIGYTGSQGLIGYVGSTGLQGPQGPAGGFTGSQGVLGFAGSIGQGTSGVTRTYFYEGVLKENYSNKRFYIAVASTLYITRVNLNTAGGTQTTININVNGVTINTVVIPAGVTYIQNTGTYSLYANDYITVDITQASSANNLYVTFVYREVL